MKIRLPEELKTRIEEASVAADRSMNAEIVQRLEQSFNAPDKSMLGELIYGYEQEIAEIRLDAHKMAEALDLLATGIEAIADAVKSGDANSPESISAIDSWVSGASEYRDEFAEYVDPDALEVLKKATESLEAHRTKHKRLLAATITPGKKKAIVPSLSRNKKLGR